MFCTSMRAGVYFSPPSFRVSPFIEKTVRRRSQCSISFVPKHMPAKEEDIDRLSRLVDVSKNIVILSGAGISTESGIPDYRSEGVGLYARNGNRPIQFQDFLKSGAVRRRYWARNFVGWPRFSSFQPNATHLSISKLANVKKIVKCTITQNVDSLHTKAGTANVIELHGTAYMIVCLGCNFTVERHAFQTLLSQLNPQFKVVDQMMRPDGDVELNQDLVDGFKVPSCPSCRGVLKPNIVFFGDNVPKERVVAVQNEIQACDALLVLGTSLHVFSAYRIVLQASELHKPIAIINIGETRGDKLAFIKISAKCGDVIPHLCR